MKKLDTIRTDRMLLAEVAELRLRGRISLDEFNIAAETLLYPINDTAMDADTFNRLRHGKKCR